MNISSYRTAASASAASPADRRQGERRGHDCGHDCAALDHGLEMLAYARDKLKSASTAAQIAHALALETEAINVMMAARHMPPKPMV